MRIILVHPECKTVSPLASATLRRASRHISVYIYTCTVLCVCLLEKIYLHTNALHDLEWFEGLCFRIAAFVSIIVAGGRQITKICRSRAARLQNARGRARAHRPPLESCTYPCVQNSIFKNLENQALLPTETLSRLYTIINNINIVFSKSSLLPSPRWTHS